MNLDEYIAKEIGLKSWQLSEHFIFEKNKVKQNKSINFDKNQITFLFSLSKSFRLNFQEKDSLKIYNFFNDKGFFKKRLPQLSIKRFLCKSHAYNLCSAKTYTAYIHIKDC